MDKNETLDKTVEWINGLINEVGIERAIDLMPNNYGGRVAILDLKDIKSRDWEFIFTAGNMTAEQAVALQDIIEAFLESVGAEYKGGGAHVIEEVK